MSYIVDILMFTFIVGASFIFERRFKKIEETCQTADSISFIEKNDQLNEINRKYKELQDEHMQMKTQLKEVEQRLQPLIDTTKSKKKLEEVIDNLIKTSDEHNIDIAAIRSTVTAKPVGFLATLTPDIHPLGDSQTIQFDNVITNIGNGYDSRSGHFVVPVKGIYVFSVTVMSSNYNYLHVQIMKNGDRVIDMYSDKNGHNNAAASMFIDLKVGDIVFVRHMPGLNDGQGIHVGRYCSFGGALITQM